ncbi:uncharacterized protein LOC133523135 [Cydia pomonella]|uniref:uncharacterized protein LOC133523135 n=1 Tax=Cydia pomonella TaxID=82600 RepID=UPI002ADE0776|nr:uncharacterized protein LOC133523135 [Cydia pomonella]
MDVHRANIGLSQRLANTLKMRLGLPRRRDMSEAHLFLICGKEFQIKQVHIRKQKVYTSVNKIQVAQRAMERTMLGSKLQDRVRNVEIQHCTKVRDVGDVITKQKWNWAGHVARQSVAE